MSTALVTGATGLLGTSLARRLVERGWEVTATHRASSDLSGLEGLGVEFVRADVRERSAVLDAVSGQDYVFHLAGVGLMDADDETVKRINVEGTRNVLELMDELDVDKGVYTSTVGLYSDAETGVVDESYTPSPPPSVYLRTKWEAHYEVAKPMIDEGLPLVVVLPGNVFGRGDKPFGTTRGILRGYLEEELSMIPRDWAFPYEYAEDTARSHIRAMEEGDPGEEYIIAGDSWTLDELLGTAESITGVPVPDTAPPTLFSVLASVMGVVERVTTPPQAL
jgi:dihydroflavonol-4-reductase